MMVDCRCLGAWALAVWLVAGVVSAAQSDRSVVEAAKAQDHGGVQALVAADADVNVAQPDGATALHWAAYWNAGETAALLISAGAELDVVNDYGITPLSLACDNGAIGMVTRLLEAGADPSVARTTGETPLMTCARTGSRDAVRALLDRGADPNAVESWYGQTALMWASGEGHTEIVSDLLSHGADVQVRSEAGFTALLIAARKDSPELVRLLVAAGADVNQAALDGVTPLLVATVRGHVALAIALLEAGADPNADGAGYTPLHWASGSWHTELTGRLQGVETERDEEWQSLNAVGAGRVTLIESLLAHGADPHARLAKTPPQYGFASSRFRVSLIGATPFLLAAMDSNVGVMQALAEAGADARVGTEEDTTPLMVAAGLGRVPAETWVLERDSIRAVQSVLDMGADVNRVNGRGRTALHGAAHIRSDTIVQLLTDHGAMVNVHDDRGITPLMIAEGGGHILLPGLGGGSTADLLRALGGIEASRDSFINNYSQGAIR